MGDVFLEQIVKKQDTVKDKIAKAFILLGGLLIFVVAFMFVWSQFFGPIAFLIAVGGIYFAWFLITGLNLEFEYIFTNGEIDIDRISAKRKRKRITTVKVSSFESFELYDHEKYKSQKFDVRINAGISIFAEGTYCAVYKGKDGQKCILTFNPSERMLDAINSKYRRKAYRN